MKSWNGRDGAHKVVNADSEPANATDKIAESADERTPEADELDDAEPEGVAFIERPDL